MTAEALTLDERPPVAEDTPKCAVCGVELAYAGKGRKPTKCPEHRSRKGPGAAAGASTGKAGSAEKLAASALDTLLQLNDWAVVALMVSGLTGTAGELVDRQERFQEQALAALMLDPELCKTILRVGFKSAKLALVAAYASMLGPCIPTAVAEIRDIRAARLPEGDPA